jgi:UDP-N-acetylmuramate--alanine ligase
MQPSFVIGADVNEVGTNAVWDQGEWLVVEADESYGTFQAIRPDLALVTNVEPDHLDHYGTFDELKLAFGTFVTSATEGAVVSADDADAAAIGREHGSTSVGTDEGATYRMTALTQTRSSITFTLSGPEGTLGEIRLGVPGLHNARNAAMAAVGALWAGAPFSAVQSALARFAGVTRRFEFRGEANGVTFVDDYAHLPSEVKAMLGAAQDGGWQRVIAVFQPHRYSRTRALWQEFGDAFADADVVMVTDVYGAGEAPIPGVSGELVVEAVRQADPGKDVRYVPGRSELRQLIEELVRPGDLVFTLGAGDLTSLPDELLDDPGW